jgi:hypothetical protein
MTRRIVLVLVAIAALCGAWSGAADAAPSRPRKVLVVSMPGMTWEDVDAGSAPTLASLADRWAIAAMSVRTVGSKTDAPSAYASIGAGNRARGQGSDQQRLAVEAAPVPGGGLRVKGMEAVQADNRSLRFGTVPGSLGSALHEAGLRTAVVGNADGGGLAPEATSRVGQGMEHRRIAGLALADLDGSLDAGMVGSSLVVPDASTLNGYRADPDAVVGAVRQTLAGADVVLVELADAYREGQIAFGRLDDPGVPALPDDDPRRVAALRRDDALLRRVAREVDLSKDTLLVLGTSGLGPVRRERLTVALMAGVGTTRGGWLTSPTTRRGGIIALTDVGPGILRLLGLPEPESMTGQPFRAVAGPAPNPARREQLFRLQAAALFHGRWVNRFFVLSLVFQLALYLFAWLRLPWGPRSEATGGSLSAGKVRSRAGVVRAVALAFMALPLATLVVRALDAELWDTWGPAAVMVATCAATVALAVRGPWRRWPSGPPAFVCALTGAVIVADLLTGSRVQMSSLIGYSPIVAGRFFGVGNLVFAVLGTSAMLVVAAAAARLPRWGPALVAAVGLVVVVAEGAPVFGADFGGILALVPAFGVLGVFVSGRRISWPKVVVLALVAAAGAFAVGFLDSLRPPEAQTHIGRFFARLMGGGPGAVSEILARKVATNWTVLTHNVLSLSVPTAVAFVALVLMRPSGRLRRALKEEPGLKWGLEASAIVNLLGFAVNDSGIAITAMGIALAVPYCLATVLGMTDEACRPAAARAGPVTVP